MKFDFHCLLSGRYAFWVSMGLNILFILLIILTGMQLTFSPEEFFASTPPHQNIPVYSQDQAFDAVLPASLFGNYLSHNVNEEQVKKSMLHVFLVGILFADNMEQSQVIIRAANGEEKTYVLGDSIPGEAIIKRITANGILVEHRGTLERLSLPKSELVFEPVAAPLKGE